MIELKIGNSRERRKKKEDVENTKYGRGYKRREMEDVDRANI